MLGLGGVLLFTVKVERVTELVDAATNRASKLRNSLRAEDREGDDQHDDQLQWSDAEGHTKTLADDLAMVTVAGEEVLSHAWMVQNGPDSRGFMRQPPREAEAPGSPALTSAREERLELGLLAQRVEV